MSKNASGPGTLLLDSSVTWANSDAGGTEKDLDVELPPVLQQDAKYLVVVRNPSTETALSGTVKGKEESWAGANRHPQLDTFSVAADTPDGKEVVVEGWLLGDGGRLTLSNDSALSASGGFTAEVRVRRL